MTDGGNLIQVIQLTPCLPQDLTVDKRHSWGLQTGGRWGFRVLISPSFWQAHTRVKINSPVRWRWGGGGGRERSVGVGGCLSIWVWKLHTAPNNQQSPTLELWRKTAPVTSIKSNQGGCGEGRESAQVLSVKLLVTLLPPAANAMHTGIPQLETC